MTKSSKIGRLLTIAADRLVLVGEEQLLQVCVSDVLIEGPFNPLSCGSLEYITNSVVGAMNAAANRTLAMPL